MRSAEDGDKVVLECLDRSFTLVNPVVSWGGQLVCNPGGSEVVSEVLGHFIVVADELCCESIGRKCGITFVETLHNISSLSGFDRDSIDVVGIVVIHDEEVFVPSGRGDGVPAREISRYGLDDRSEERRVDHKCLMV